VYICPGADHCWHRSIYNHIRREHEDLLFLFQNSPWLMLDHFA
jgi:hypothetical protein